MRHGRPVLASDLLRGACVIHPRAMLAGSGDAAGVLVLPLGGRTPGPQASQRPAGESTAAQLAGARAARPIGDSWRCGGVVDREFIATNAPSLTMAVAQEGQLLWARAWGWADKEQHVRATPQTPYILASVSKSITATALFTLVERGTINLDAPIETYLGGLTLRADGGPARDATVRRVLSHTAGLPSFQNVFFADESRRVPPLTDTIRRYGLIVHKPGERFVYSNLGYSILGHAIATVSGQSLSAFMQREVFEPLRMTRSALGTAPLSAPPAIPYTLDGTRLPAYEQSTIAASSAFASAEDLVRFGLLHVKALAPGQRKILSNGSIDVMQQRIAPSPFGMGWFVFDGRASGVVFHGGGMDGVSTVIFLVPARRLVVVGLCSTIIDLPGRAAAEIIHRLVPGVQIEPPIPPPVSPEPTPSSLTGEWAGELLAANGAHAFQLSIDASGQMTRPTRRSPARADPRAGVDRRGVARHHPRRHRPR